MNKFITPILIVITSILVCNIIISRQKSDFNAQIDNLKLEYNMLELESTLILDSIEVYKELIKISIFKSDSLSEVLTTLKTKRYEVPNNVDDYTPSKLDSILTTYQHPR